MRVDVLPRSSTGLVRADVLPTSSTVFVRDGALSAGAKSRGAHTPAPTATAAATTNASLRVVTR